MKKLLLILNVFLILFLTSCKKDDNNPVTPEEVKGAGVYVLSEGLMTQNNSSLSFYDIKNDKNVEDAYFKANNAKLGDTGNDMQVFKTTGYIVLDISAKIEIINIENFKSLGSVNVGKGGRELCIINENLAYLTSYENGGCVKKIDLKEKKVLKTIKVGANPEAIIYVKGKLFVANTGGGTDRTISVIDIAGDNEVKKINVGFNPTGLVNDEKDNIFVVCPGGWQTGYNTKVGLYKINSSTYIVVDSVKSATFPSFPGSVVIADNNLLIVGATGIEKVDKDKLTLSGLFLKNSDVGSSIYGIAYDSKDKKLYLGNPKDYSQNGDIAVFDLNGKFIKRFNCGINPGTIRIVN